MTEAYPLAWPEGWPRTPPAEQRDGRAAFKRQLDNGRYRSGQPWTFAAARDALLEEIGRHGAMTCVVSTNFALDRRFLAVEGKRRPDDQGVAVYFQRKGRPIVMACDRYRDAEGNMRSLTLALEALRQLERHGGGVMMERAYEGFTALPAPKRWWEVLGVPADATPDDIERAYRAKARHAHPDAGGSEAAMSELNRARDEGRKQGVTR
jgi:hypothetical protein